ncbi:MAG TPA: hypothetical protein PKY59_20250 [Pyrinomonadaceae bacterium]|nr:hypothetical protein [Pyrinomonadaceae bacterium]
MKFAKYTFTIAGIYGLLALLPQYFMEAKNSADFPPAINHPEYYYGFVGVALAFQVVFLIIGRDPVRYRPLMLASVIEKFSFAIAAIFLLMQNRIPLPLFGAAMIDLLLGIFFIISFVVTPKNYQKT